MLGNPLIDLNPYLELPAVQWGLSLVKAAAILGAGWLAAQLGMRWLTTGLRRLQLDLALVAFLSSLIYSILLVVVAIAVLAQLGVQTASLVTVLGAVGLALALSLQNSLSNLASGIIILGYRFFRAGDTIEVAGARGRVTEMLIFHTILSTEDGQRVLIPNSKITSEIVRHVPYRPAAPTEHPTTASDSIPAPS